MSFAEAMTRARAVHVVAKVCHQPGNDYRREYICKCGAFVFAVDWNAHILAAADEMLPDTQQASDE